MKVISIINLKGGVGKTFTSYNMAYELGKRGYKVLVLDNDKQGNISRAFGMYSPHYECDASMALMGEYNSPYVLITPINENIDLIRANMSLMGAVSKLYKAAGNQIDGYKKLIETPYINFYNLKTETLSDRYDYMIIDNPPDIAFNVAAALRITDEVIVPVKIDEWALEGLDIIADQINEAKAINPKIKLLGALVTMYRNNDTNIAGLEWLKKKSPIKVLGKIRYTEKAAESTFYNKPIYEYSPRCGAAQDYKHFVTEYLQQNTQIRKAGK